MTWKHILRDYMATPNISFKHHPHKTLDAFIGYLEQNYAVPKEVKVIEIENDIDLIASKLVEKGMCVKEAYNTVNHIKE